MNSLLEAKNVSKYYGSFPALRGLSFEVKSGQCVALLGRNGAGKTTLLKILSRLSRQSEGEIVCSARVSILGHGIGVYDELSARQNLAFFAQLLPVAVDIDAWLHRVNLQMVADAPLREYSRGMRQRLALARTFMGEPELLLLDEPFTSLDDKATALLQSLLQAALERGAAVLLSTHQIPEAMALASDVLFLERGKLAFAGPRPTEMLNDPGWLYRNFGAVA